MHSQETINNVIELRAQGLSFDRIGKALNISPSTAFEWADKFNDQIERLRRIQLEAVYERVFANCEQEATYLAEELKRVQAELRERDYGYVNTEQLYWYQATLLAK